MTVLVVDDEPAYRMLLRDLLMAEGIEVLTAENGEEGLRKLSVVHPDMIVSDVYMPIMDGAKLHRAVRQIPQYEKLPFLFVSGASDGFTLGAVRDPRYDGFFKKGRPLQELLALIRYLTAPEDKRDKFVRGQSARGS